MIGLKMLPRNRMQVAGRVVVVTAILVWAVSTSFLFLGGARCPQKQPPAGNRAAAAALRALTGQSDTVSIITWNIRYDNPADGIHAWLKRRDDLLSFVLSKKPDIFCIQEGLYEQVAFLKRGLAGYEMRGVGRDDGKEEGEYSAIYFNTSRFSSNGNGTFWLSPTPSVPGKGWDAALPRIVTWVRLADKSGTAILYIFNTHFDHQGAKARENSALLLRKKVGEIAGGSPVVVAGDFNAVETEPPYRILTSADQSVPRLEDGMLRSLAGHSGPSGTFTGFEPADPDTCQRIDYLFVGGSLTVLRYATLLARGRRGFLSDHLPVAMDICLSRNP